MGVSCCRAEFTFDGEMMGFMVKLNDLQRMWEVVGREVLDAVKGVGESGWFVLGREVEGFEDQLAEFWGLHHAVGVANGLDAIEIGLRSLGIARGDEVLTTPLSAFATTLAITRAGAVPVFCDVDDAGLLDLQLCREVVANRPTIRWMVPVHLYGHALDLQALEALRDEFEIKIVEDCAQSIGATSRGQVTGSVGHAAATSFYPTKNLGALGDAGASLTQNDEVAGAARVLRHYGQSATYVHDLPGLNSRLDELQAAVLARVFLPRLPEWTARRREVAGRYREEIDSPLLSIPPVPPGSESVWHLFPVLVDSADRQSFIAHMKGRGVQTGIHYPRLITEQKALEDGGGFRIEGSLDRAKEFAAREVSIPIHPFLHDEEVDAVIGACNAWRSR
jgi:dTDP-3-amino-3,4,6-trideoxy-alpha-D-glucose transaminase